MVLSAADARNAPEKAMHINEIAKKAYLEFLDVFISTLLN
jgi:hypothetical protein